MAYVYSEQDDNDLTYFINYNLNKMSFQRHKTAEEKFERKLKFIELRESGQSLSRARRFRDWTLDKVRLITEGIAKPN